jgi:Predicted Zn-dependent peptidases
MKKLFLFAALIIASLGMMSAQNETLPIDEKVRYGRLENGLTYYIRHNEMPKDRVEFHIAQKVGAMQEEDSQNGLAHFLEHMCFNGTKNFPGNGVIQYCESIGVKFGVDLNAYTSFDQTVYRISNVPTTREAVMDSCLLIIHDWAGALLLEEDEINKERGVIREEMRSGMGANRRLLEKTLPQIFPNNRYGQRNVIGTEDIIMNFEPQVLRDYYHKWYRPDLQAVIVVGDIDIEAMEVKIQQIFSDLAMPANPAERVYISVEDNVEPLIAIATDKEATIPDVSIAFKHEAMPHELRGTTMALISDYMNQVASSIMSERFRDIIQQANPPFLNAYAYDGTFIVAATVDAWQGHAYIKDGNVEEGWKALVREMERVDRYGFTAAEYERAKANILTHYEKTFNEREKTLHNRYANEYISNFIKGDYIPGIEMEYNIISSVAPMFPVEVINEYVMSLMGEENIVIMYSGPENETVPTKEQLLAWYKEVQLEEIEAIQEALSDEPLISETLKGGKIVKESHDKAFDATVYTLSNGVKVVIKPTTLKDDEILMTATSPGGESLFPETEPVNIQLYNYVAAVGGVGNFSSTDLSKVLAGRQASVYPTISLMEEGFSGNSTVRDFETMLQLIYLNFTSPRMDQEAYESLIGRLRSQLEAMEANPDMAFYERVPMNIYENPTRFKQLKAADLDQANYNLIMTWRKERYADASDFTFTFVGNIDPEATKDLIALYLGSLPSIDRKESFEAINNKYNAGFRQDHFNQKMDIPKATVFDAYWTVTDFDQKNNLTVDMLRQILTIVYQEKIREDEGGTYGVGVGANLNEYPKGRIIFQISFETEPGKHLYLNEIVQREFKDIAENGPREEDFAKVKEFMIKQHADEQQQNSYWRNRINYYNRTGLDWHTNYSNILDDIKPADIQKLAKQVIDSGNLIEVIMIGFDVEE